MPTDEMLKQRARELRNNATAEENDLWYKYLRNHEVRFTRQKAMPPYIVDFYCPKARLVVEIDGSQHYEPDGIAHDETRTRFLESRYGVKVIRIPNNEIHSNLSGVCDYIDQVLRERMAQIGDRKTSAGRQRSPEAAVTLNELEYPAAAAAPLFPKKG